MKPAAAQAPAPGPGAGTDEAVSQTGALLAELRGGSGAVDAPGASRSKRRFSSQTILTAAIVVVGAGMLYGMRHYGMKSGMTFQVVAIDWDQARASSGNTPEEDRILAALTRTGETQQVPKEDIEKNPFLLGMDEPEAMPEVAHGAAPTLAERMAELTRQRKVAREAEIRAALGSIELQSIVTGTRPVAKINGKVHVVGDIVAEHLKVTVIGGRSVTLEADGQSHVVEIGAQPHR